MNRYQVFPNLSAADYQPHPLHTDVYAWVEKNCYIDLMIEILHAQGLEPFAILPFTLAINFEGDQWTFFKPQHSEIRDLYGIDIQELSVWRPLIDHAVEHLGAGCLISVEADAFWLPDTTATDYRRQHVKTTIALADLDLDQQRLGYFHNAGYFELADEDFRALFQLDKPIDPGYLPLYAELIHRQQIIRREHAELVNLSLQLLKRYLQLRPQDNPITHFAARFPQELALMQSRGLTYYHAWAFNNTRQLGAAFELAAAYLKWLGNAGVQGLNTAIQGFEEISTGNKSMILKIARAVNSGRALDLSDAFKTQISAWDRSMRSLDDRPLG